MPEIYGPRTEHGQLLHGMKYRDPGETYDDYCIRYARTTTDTPQEFRRQLPYTRDQIILPAGRQQRAVGRPFETTAFNCLGRDTLVLTREYGVVDIASLAGTRVTIIDGEGDWCSAEFGSYGIQPLYSVEFTNGKKHLIVLATAEHDWIIAGQRVSTRQLRRNDRIDFVSRSRSDEITEEYFRHGIAHGVVYGDGTRSQRRFGFTVRLCGEKRELMEYLGAFPHSYPPSSGGDPHVYFYGRNASTDMKMLPDINDTNLSYLQGFLRGWLAADGCVSTQPEVTICGDEQQEAWLRQYGPLVGFNVIGSTITKQTETNFGQRKVLVRNIRLDLRFLTIFDFLLAKHRERFVYEGDNRWRVASVSEEPVFEDEVFCAIVPTTHSFMLAGGLHSGNCFVMGEIPDTTAGIFESLRDAALTLRAGGGIGMDFSTLRPQNEPVRGLGHGACASGPVSFMNCWHTMCATMMSAGERRGAMMGMLNVHHPDIMQFIRAKQDQHTLTNFNISVGVTDEFMEAVIADKHYELKFGGVSFGRVRALDVWAAIMEMNWDWAEPGVVFLSIINRLNPLYYCEHISATNPCAEQALPPWGACLLGSTNLVKLLVPKHEANGVQLAAQSGKQIVRYELDYERLDEAVDIQVRSYDRVIDRTVFPLPQQEAEAKAKRRMGIGVTGMANALEVMGLPYASPAYLDMQDVILERSTIQAYRTSCELAKERGPFPLWDADKYCEGEFFKTRLPEDLQYEIRKHGLRNGLLTSIAPTGTISQTADYVSSGIEPAYMMTGDRQILTPQGPHKYTVTDYAYAHYGVRGRTATEISGEEHVDVLCRAQWNVDNSISKTCNVNGQISGQGPGVTYSDFKALYLRAWEGGAKSCSLYNTNGKRAGILQPKEEEVTPGMACFPDPVTGERECAAE